jgi:hypothetical protein
MSITYCGNLGAREKSSIGAREHWGSDRSIGDFTQSSSSEIANSQFLVDLSEQTVEFSSQFSESDLGQISEGFRGVPRGFGSGFGSNYHVTLDFFRDPRPPLRNPQGSDVRERWSEGDGGFSEDRIQDVKDQFTALKYWTTGAAAKAELIPSYSSDMDRAELITLLTVEGIEATDHRQGHQNVEIPKE